MRSLNAHFQQWNDRFLASLSVSHSLPFCSPVCRFVQHNRSESGESDVECVLLGSYRAFSAHAGEITGTFQPPAFKSQQNSSSVFWSRHYARSPARSHRRLSFSWQRESSPRPGPGSESDERMALQTVSATKNVKRYKDYMCIGFSCLSRSSSSTRCDVSLLLII